MIESTNWIFDYRHHPLVSFLEAATCFPKRLSLKWHDVGGCWGHPSCKAKAAEVVAESQGFSFMFLPGFLAHPQVGRSHFLFSAGRGSFKNWKWEHQNDRVSTHKKSIADILDVFALWKAKGGVSDWQCSSPFNSIEYFTNHFRNLQVGDILFQWTNLYVCQVLLGPRWCGGGGFLLDKLIINIFFSECVLQRPKSLGLYYITYRLSEDGMFRFLKLHSGFS